MTTALTDYYASIIASEASGFEGQLAVADTIQNRIDQGIPIQGAYASNQNPTQQSQFLADQIPSNNLPDITGGATSFRATNYPYPPGNPISTSIQQGGPSIGGNSFSQGEGAPTQAYLDSYAAGQQVYQNNATGFQGGSNAPLADAGAAPYSPSYSNPSQAYGMPGGAATAPPNSNVTQNYIDQGGYGPYPSGAVFGQDANIPGAGGGQPTIAAPAPGSPAIAMPNTATDPSATLANGSAGYQLPNGVATAAPAPVAAAGGPSGAVGSGSAGLGGGAATGAPTSMRANSLNQSTAQAGAGQGGQTGGGGPTGMWEMVGASAVDYAGNTSAEASKKAAETVKTGLGDVQKSVEELNKGVAQDTQQFTQNLTQNTQALTASAEKGYGTAANLVGDIQGTSSSFLVRWALIGAGFIVLWAGFRMATAGAK
jgi:hypothetical protein